MAKKRTSLLGFLFLILVLAAGRGVHAAIPESASIENRLASVLTLTEPEIDLAETLLLISRDRDSTLDLAPLRAELDRLTQSVREQLQASSSPEEIVSALRKTIHQEGGYRYTEKVDAQGIPLNPAELFLHGMLTSKRGYCMNLSLLYLIIGDRLNLPLFGVPLPNHFFVRYVSGDVRINIEATEQGATYPDSFYRSRFGAPAAGKGTFFMGNLGKKATLGAYFSNVGMVYYKDRQRQPKKAIFYLDLATKINPFSIEALNNLGNIYSETQQIGKAIRQYQLALQADPGNLSSLYNLGLAYDQSGQADKAIESFLQVVQIAPTFTPGHQSLINLFLEKRRYFSALLHLEKLAQLAPGNYQTQIAIGTVYLRMGQHPLALQTFNDLRKKYPDKEEVLEPLAETYYRMENFDKAVELYRYLIEHHPDLLKAYIQLGWTHYRKNEIDLAIAWTRRGLKEGRGTESLVTLAQMNLGFYSLLNRTFPKARQWYRKALAGKDPSAVSGMVGDIEEAARQYPNRPELDFFVGWIYFKSGQKENARLVLERYLEKHGSGQFANEARDLLQNLTFKKAALPTQAVVTKINSEKIAAPENMALVPAGFFSMGSNQNGLDEKPEHEVFVDAFFMDRYEVSAREYADFLNAVNNVKGYYLDNKYGTLSFNERFQPRPGMQSLPINNVNWKGAVAYCRWKKKRLPTEAEWEKAARGTDKRIFPWGDSRPTPERARYFQTWTDAIRHKVMVSVDALPDGNSQFGLHNMAGNVKEWVDDWYDREYYAESSEYTNPRGPIGGEFKALRGGSWRDLGGFVYSSFRNNSSPGTRMDDYGFRCAKSVGEKVDKKKLTRWQEKPFNEHQPFNPTHPKGL
jgi:formylglycine-generating enzyme required for sulfatase activity/regulator of sirC expression with transglutaminase-like and TPR domain